MGIVEANKISFLCIKSNSVVHTSAQYRCGIILKDRNACIKRGMSRQRNGIIGVLKYAVF